MKKISVIAAVLLALFVFSVSAREEITVTVSGEAVAFDVAPEIINGRTFVPVRAIFEAMGASVSWDAKNETVFAEKLGKTIEFEIGDKEVDYSGKKVKLDAAPLIKNGRTLVPARFAAEGFGYVVLWNEESRTVEISHNISVMTCYEGTTVPDYGALYGFEYAKTEDNVYIYDISDIAEMDKNAESIKDYIDILYEMGAEFSGEEKVAENGKSGTLFSFSKDGVLLTVGVLNVEGEDGLFISIKRK